MHSRKKGVVDEKQKNEQKAKILKFNGAMKNILQMKQQGVRKVELLKGIGELLTKCPECTTLWNYRREIFIDYRDRFCAGSPAVEEGSQADETNQDTVDHEAELAKLCNLELGFIESCLKINPKAYGAWHHRVWLQTFMKENVLDNELLLCNEFLKYDERNFHCWDYRRIVAKMAEIPHKRELEFATSKIDENFSNFSAWHYRSSLLTKIQASGSEDDQKFVAEMLNSDLEKVQEAIFTDPADQSAWFYLRWLLTVQSKGFDSSKHSQKTLVVKPEMLKVLEELHEMEPDNVWINYILAWIEPKENLILKLIELDPLRKNFYKHLRTDKTSL